MKALEAKWYLITQMCRIKKLALRFSRTIWLKIGVFNPKWFKLIFRMKRKYMLSNIIRNYKIVQNLN